MKHKRKIALEPWQERTVERHPGRLLRGLIHSDGCRTMNRIRTPGGRRGHGPPRRTEALKPA
jgi:hypothetical protein